MGNTSVSVANLAGTRSDHPRVLHLIGSVDPRSGGPIEGILRQDATLGAIGSREIASLDTPDAAFLRDHPMTVHALGPDTPRRGGFRLWRGFGYSPKFVPWLRAHAHEYDCIIVNGLWNYSSVGASMALPFLPTPYFVFTHGMMDPWFKRRYPLKHALKVVFWTLFEGRLLSRAKAVLFTTEEEKRLASNQFPFFSFNPEMVGFGTADCPPGDDVQKAAFRRSIPALGEAPYVLFMSRLHEKKGYDLLVQGFAEVADAFPDVHLVMAGPDQEGAAGRWRAFVDARGLGARVHFPGMLEGDAKWGALKGALGFSLPSHQENFGIVVAEAAACATPVLITDKVNIWREIERYGAGLVADDTQDGITAQLRAFLSLDEDRRREMGRGARECFTREFDIVRTADTLMSTIARYR